MEKGFLQTNVMQIVLELSTYKDCPGLNIVIPGKTPLPPNKELPLRLQNVDSDPQDSINENF